MTSHVESRPIGDTGLHVTSLGYGAMKIGRNQGVKYPAPYEIPGETTVAQLLNSILDLGCTLIDTAPAYGLSEERIGRSIGHRRSEFTLCTKVGESFEDGLSRFDFSTTGIRRSIERSLIALRTECLDVVLIHSNGDDLKILEETDTVAILQDFKNRGLIRAIGMSAKSVEGVQRAVSSSDVLMVEYSPRETSLAPAIELASRQGVAVFVKKGLSSGHLPADESIRFVLSNPGVTSLIVGGLDINHFRENWRSAMAVRPSSL